jgi:hypothetical protein
VEEEEQLMLATVEKEIPADDEEDENFLAAVAHFIMVHYKEKEGIKKKKKKKYKPKAGQYQMEAGIKRFGERGEIAVTKELDQFNKYKVLSQNIINDFSKRKEERNNKGKVLCKWECSEGACCKRGSSGANGWT